MKQDWPEHFIMKRQGAHGACAGLIARAAVAFLGSEAEVRLCSASAGVFKARRVPPALFPDLTGERSGSSHRSRKWDAASTLTPFLQSGSGLPAARGEGSTMSGQTVHLHPALQGCGWRFPKDLVNIVSSGVLGWRGPPRGDRAATRGARESCEEGAAEPRVGEGNQHREGRADWGLPPGSGIDLCSPSISISIILQKLGGGQRG